MGRIKRYDVIYNPEHYTVVANDIVKGKQTMTLQTAKLIRLVITQVVKEDKDLKTYVCRISDLAEFLGISRNNLYRDIDNICDCAMKSVVYVGSGNPKRPWKRFNWLSMSEYDGNGMLTIRLSDEIKPYVLDLDKWFTQYKLKNILEFNSYYAIRLYEIIQCSDSETLNDKSVVDFDICELRQYLNCENKYKMFADFNRNVINVGIREINKKSDIFLTATYKKKSRAVTGIQFEVSLNRDNLYKTL